MVSTECRLRSCECCGTRGVWCARAYVWYVCLQPLALAVAQFNLVVTSGLGDKAITEHPKVKGDKVAVGEVFSVAVNSSGLTCGFTAQDPETRSQQRQNDVLGEMMDAGGVLSSFQGLTLAA